MPTEARGTQDQDLVCDHASEVKKPTYLDRLCRLEALGGQKLRLKTVVKSLRTARGKITNV